METLKGMFLFHTNHTLQADFFNTTFSVQDVIIEVSLRISLLLTR